MNTDLILSNINSIVRLDKEETAFLESVLIARPFKQGELLVKSGETSRYIMFVNAGYLMTYYTDQESQDHVIQFAGKGWWAGDIYMLNKDINTLYSTKGLCDGEVLLLPRLAQNRLLDDYTRFERYFRITFQNALIRQQMRFVESHSKTAEVRYQTFLNGYPGIDQYIQQKYIASFLGITPEFLSKVRKKLMRNKS